MQIEEILNEEYIAFEDEVGLQEEHGEEEELLKELQDLINETLQPYSDLSLEDNHIKFNYFLLKYLSYLNTWSTQHSLYSICYGRLRSRLK